MRVKPRSPSARLSRSFSTLLDPLKFDLGLDFLKVNSDVDLQISGDVILNLGFGVSKAANQ